MPLSNLITNEGVAAYEALTKRLFAVSVGEKRKIAKTTWDGDVFTSCDKDGDTVLIGSRAFYNSLFDL